MIGEIHPRGYVRSGVAASHAMAVDLAKASRLIFIAGQVGYDREGKIVGPDLAVQLDQAYENIGAVVSTAGGTMQNVVSLRTYLSDRDQIQAFRDARATANRRIWGDGPYPANTLLVVSALADPALLIEIEAVAVI